MKWSAIDGSADKLLDQSQQEIAGYYKGALDSVSKDLSVYARKGHLNKADMLNHSRLLKLEDNIIEEMGKVTGLSKRELQKTLGEVYQDSFYRTGYKFEAQVEHLLAYSRLDPDTVKQVINNPMDRIGWINRLEANQAKTLEQLKQEIFTGLTKGDGYDEIANTIKSRMETGTENINRIVRTEGHRCREQGKLDSMKHAEKMGVNALKRWLAGKDARTRASHREVDGQKKQITEDFKVGGYTAQGPGMTGIASEDINCRCTMISIVEGFTPQEERIKGEGYKPFQTYKSWLNAKVRGEMFPKTLVKVPKGEAMTIEQARGNYMLNGRVSQPSANHKYMNGTPWQINCQTSVVAHEARHRGYKVIAKGNTSGSKLQLLSRDTALAWVDPVTMAKPSYIKLADATTAKKTYKALNSTLVEGQRYTMEWAWKGGRSGHIVNVGKENGKVFLFDPQSGTLINEQAKLEAYFSRFRFKFKTYDMTIPTPPQLIRVDNKLFNMNMVEEILERGIHDGL